MDRRSRTCGGIAWGGAISTTICHRVGHIHSSAALRLLRGGATFAVAADRLLDGADPAGVCAHQAEACYALDQLAHGKPPHGCME